MTKNKNDAAQLGAPAQTSAGKPILVRVLVTLISIVAVIIVVGTVSVLLMSQSRDNRHVMGEAVISSEATSAAPASQPIGSTPSSQGDLQASASAPQDDAAAQATQISSRGVPTSCLKLPYISGLEDGYVFPGEDAGNGSYTYVDYCDGTWAQTGYGRMTWGPAQKWNGTTWESIPYDVDHPYGESAPSEGCYWPETLLNLGAPDTFLHNSYIETCPDS